MSRTAVCSVAAILLTAPAALGIGTIIQPTAASTNMGWFNTYEPFRVIDQSGLAANYTSGVTDFTSFVTTTGTVNGGSSFTGWYSNLGTTGNFDFALGGSYMIDSFALWNDPQASPNQGVNQFRLLGDDNAAFSSPTVLITANATDGIPNATNFGQWFLFSPDSQPVTHIRMEILSNHGSTLTTGFVEAAFGYGIIPAPGAAGVFACGAALALRRRRR